MKRTKNIIRNLAMSMLSLLFATIALEYYFVRENHDIEIFKERLREKENEADKVFHKNIKQIKKGDYENLKGKIVSYYVYKNNELIYWSDFRSHIPHEYSADFFSPNLLQINNGYYSVRNYTIGNTRIVALIYVYEKYPFENKYLENRFTNYFQQIHKNRVYKSEKKGVPIYTKEGKYLLSLSKGKKLKKNSPILILIFVLYFISLGFLAFSLMRKIFTSNYKLQLILIPITGITVFIIRYIMLEYKEPISFTGLMLFSPKLHASSLIHRSLGDLWLNIAFFHIFIYSISLLKVKDIPWLKNKLFSGIITFLFFCVLLFFSDYAFEQVKSLVNNSTFPLQIETTTIDIMLYTIWAYSGAILFFFLIITTTEIITILARNNYSPAVFHISWLTISLTALLLSVLFHPAYIDKIIFISILGFSQLLRKSDLRGDLNYLVRVVVILMCSIFLTHLINEYSAIKEKQSSAVQAKNIIYADNPLRRIMLETMATDIEQDQRLNKKLINPIKNEKEIKQYIKTKYFNYKWSNYSIDVFFCHENIEDVDKKCNEAWEYLHNSTQIIGDSFFYKITSLNNTETYIGEIYFDSHKYNELRLIITIKRKLYEDELGYPELLMNSILYTKKANKYSYAKYFGNKLQFSKGDFDYYNNFSIFEKKGIEEGFVKVDGYNHYTYAISDDLKIVISKKMTSLYKAYNILPYIFILFFTMFTFIGFVKEQRWGSLHLGFFQQRIKYLFTFVLIIMFTIIGFIGFYYTYKSNKDRYTAEHRDKVRKIRKELFGNIKNTFDLKKTIWNEESFSLKLKEASKLIGADINIYDTEGKLLATSQPEIFNENIISSRMNNEAKKVLLQNRMKEVTIQEQIGRLEYSSVYATIWDNKNNAIAYLNIPFFLNYEEFISDIQTVIIALLSVGLFVIIFIIIIVYIISQEITKSFSYLQEKFANIHLTKRNKPIEYIKQDELTPLIDAYNKMVIKIKKQSEELAQSEKESAWRDMARQIAHEIRNPLTPMKLNIQFLQRKLMQKDESWEDKFYEISDILLKEIDELTDTASSFSDFAKISKTYKESKTPVDLVLILHELSTLYAQNKTNLILETKLNKALILGEKMQIRRIFINTISNAIQATAKKEYSEVKITIKEKNGWVKIFIKDNGSGIKKNIRDKIFTPNFTTKNSGMGLGLAITKEIIKQSKGSIRFKTVEGKGTLFLIQFPLFDKKKNQTIR